jgi:hypothetical protein
MYDRANRKETGVNLHAEERHLDPPKGGDREGFHLVGRAVRQKGARPISPEDADRIEGYFSSVDES